MSEVNSSKSLEDEVQNDEEKSQLKILQQFASKVNQVFDEADEKLLNLIEDIDKLMEEEKGLDDEVKQKFERKIEPTRNDKQNDTFWYSRSSEKPSAYVTLSPKPLSNDKKLTVGQLARKKQDLMQKLRQVDKSLLQHKFQPVQPVKQLKEIRSPKQSQQNTDLKPLPQGSNPFKPQKLSQNANKTLELMDQLNREKIKRHEQMIQRMQQRQQEELKKIRELEERRIKIELKKTMALSESRKNLSPINRKTLPKKIF